LTKRTNKPKATPTIAPTINSTASVSPVESVKVESKAKVATTPKRANSAAKKAPSKPRARSKKVAEIVSPSKVVDAESRIITYVAPMTMAKPAEPNPSLYDRFVGWLFKVTLPFRGY
jgi:hypothetical protein